MRSKKIVAVIPLMAALFSLCGTGPTESLSAPEIIVPPESRTGVAGRPLTFTVVATGKPDPAYQWQKDGVDLPAGNESSYTIPSLSLADSGSYTVVVSNTAGSVTSAAALLTVHTLPQFTQQPISDSVSAGSPFSFTVVATGVPAPTSYQWRLNGFDIPSADSTTYSKTAATVQDAGTYTVAVTNAAGTAYSDPAVLTVTP